MGGKHPGLFATQPTDRLLETAGQSKLQPGRRRPRPDRARDRRRDRHRDLRDHRRGDRRPPGRRSSSPSLLAGVTCIFSALSYAELASAIPISGSAYTYTYATMGELIAFIIGWDLILEYGLSIAAIAVGWGGYLNALLDSLFSIEIPKELANPPGEMGGQFNAPAVFLVLAVTARARRRDQGERPLEHGDGRHQARGPRLLHRRRRHRLRQLQLRAVRARTASPGWSMPPR